MNPRIWPSLARAARSCLAVLPWARHWAARQVSLPAPPDLIITMTQHASQRALQRTVTKEQIASVLAKPDRVIPRTESRSVRLEQTVGSRVLKVWVVAPWTRTEEIVVKSTAWSDRHTRTCQIPANRVGEVIGRKGRVINEIEESTGAKIQIHNGVATITADSEVQLMAAIARINSIIS